MDNLIVQIKHMVQINWVYRQLDDVPVVVLYHKKFWCKEFWDKFRNFAVRPILVWPSMKKIWRKFFDPSQVGQVPRTWCGNTQYTKKREKDTHCIGRILDRDKMDL